MKISDPLVKNREFINQIAISINSSIYFLSPALNGKGTSKD